MVTIWSNLAYMIGTISKDYTPKCCSYFLYKSFAGCLYSSIYRKRNIKSIPDAGNTSGWLVCGLRPCWPFGDFHAQTENRDRDYSLLPTLYFILPMTIDSYGQHPDFDKAVGLHCSESLVNNSWYKQTSTELGSRTLAGRHAYHYSTRGSQVIQVSGYSKAKIWKHTVLTGVHVREVVC